MTSDEFVTTSAPPPLNFNSPLRSVSGLLMPTSASSNVLVMLADPEIVRLLMVRFVDGVWASMVTVLVLALVMSVEPRLELGARPVDQFVPSFQKPLPALVQLTAAKPGSARDGIRHARNTQRIAGDVAKLLRRNIDEV